MDILSNNTNNTFLDDVILSPASFPSQEEPSLSLDFIILRRLLPQLLQSEITEYLQMFQSFQKIKKKDAQRTRKECPKVAQRMR